MVIQADFPQPMEIHGGEDIHPQPMDSHMPGGVGGCKLKEVAACGQTMLEQTGSWQDCDLLVIHAVPDCTLWKGTTPEERRENNCT